MAEVMFEASALGAIWGLFAVALWLLLRWYRRSLKAIRDDYEAACAAIAADSDAQLAAIRAKYEG